MSNKIEKPRENTINIETGGKVHGLRVNPKAGTITLIGTTGEKIAVPYSQGLYYERESGKPKFIQSISGVGDSVSFHGFDLACSFDRVVVLDTNKRSINGVEIAACCFVVLDVVNSDGKFNISSLPFLNFYQIIGMDRTPELIKTNPELVAVYLITSFFFERHGREIPSERVLIVIDTELESHQAYNSGELPIFKDRHLRDGCQIVYSGADALGGSFNKMVRFCDKEASNFLSELEKDNVPKALPEPLIIELNIEHRFLFREGLIIDDPVVPEENISLVGKSLTLIGRK